MKHRTFGLLAVLCLAGCGSTDDEARTNVPTGGAGRENDPDPMEPKSEASDEPLDQRTEVPDPPPGGVQFLSGEYVIEAGEEKQMCLIQTYDGPDVGIHGLNTYQTGQGHHVAFLATTVSPEEFPDGEPFDCTKEEDFDMTLLTPLFLGTAVGLDGINEVTLPDGMAAMMRSGTRIVVQSHYVNATTDKILVRDGFNVDLMPASEVEVWAAPFFNATLGFEVPTGDELSVQFDCTFGQDVNLLYLYGHMHDWGARFHVDLTRVGESTERIYEVEEWRPDYRDHAPLNDYGKDAFFVGADDVVTTSCTWANDTDSALGFPQEMCLSLGMLYPAKETIACTVLPD